MTMTFELNKAIFRPLFLVYFLIVFILFQKYVYHQKSYRIFDSSTVSTSVPIHGELLNF